jgi:hypothetical protein
MKLCFKIKGLLAGTVLAFRPRMGSRDMGSPDTGSMDMISLRRKVEELERKEILTALSEAGWIKARAARKLGLTERMLSYRIKKYGLKIMKEVVISNEVRGRLTGHSGYGLLNVTKKGGNEGD